MERSLGTAASLLTLLLLLAILFVAVTASPLEEVEEEELDGDRGELKKLMQQQEAVQQRLQEQLQRELHEQEEDHDDDEETSGETSESPSPPTSSSFASSSSTLVTRSVGERATEYGDNKANDSGDSGYRGKIRLAVFFDLGDGEECPAKKEEKPPSPSTSASAATATVMESRAAAAATATATRRSSQRQLLEAAKWTADRLQKVAKVDIGESVSGWMVWRNFEKSQHTFFFSFPVCGGD